ncbi:MAG TPA: DNRLRE domain-containing protein, partial [Anaerolineales bacterium]|nr:DNRLRE domain-containing protein [Anaerolineales bacterium]
MTFYMRRSKHTTVRRTNNFVYPLLILILTGAVSLLACTPGVPTTAPTNEQPPLTFTAEADAQVREDEPDTNTGTSAFLQVEGGNDPNVESFLRFTVNGVSAPIQNARLRLYNMTDASRNGPVVYATDISWSETEITWNNRPPRIGEELDNLGDTDKEAWEEYDVTATVTGNGTFSFVLVADSSDATKFSSREGSQPPQLVITLAGSSTPTLDAATATPSTPTPTATSSASAPDAPVSLAAEADARVSQADPNTNFGNAPILRVDGTGDSEVESFLRFTVPKVSGPIQSVQLRLYVTDNGTENGPAVYATDNSWGERSIKWNNRPEHASNALDNKGNL